MKDLQQLKSVIQATNPEIMELKFGCEVLLEDMSDFPDYIGLYAGKRLADTLVLHKQGKELFPIDRKYKILGRPIRLADCFEACLMFAKRAKPGEGWIYKIVELWNLTDDNLDHQSPECQEFLINLLCK